VDYSLLVEVPFTNVPIELDLATVKAAAQVWLKTKIPDGKVIAVGVAKE
jgi:hypothetical protein